LCSDGYNMNTIVLCNCELTCKIQVIGVTEERSLWNVGFHISLICNDLCYLSTLISGLPFMTETTTESPSLNVALLQSSFLKLEPQAQEFSDTFYRILLNKYPRLIPLFSETDMEKQKVKLMESLKLVMVNVYNTEALTFILKNLGKRHVQYGAVLTDYPLIGDALLQSLDRHLGADWTPDVRETWTLAYQMIADTMAAGAREATTVQPPSTKESTIEPVEQIFDRDADSISESQSAIDTSSKSSIIGKLLLIGSLGLTGICGYVLLNQMNHSSDSQPPTSTQPGN
jgi:nitric oxide dioxygenase